MIIDYSLDLQINPINGKYYLQTFPLKQSQLMFRKNELSVFSLLSEPAFCDKITVRQQISEHEKNDQTQRNYPNGDFFITKNNSDTPFTVIFYGARNVVCRGKTSFCRKKLKSRSKYISLMVLTSVLSERYAKEF